jgi:N-acetyl-anhydromuramyl-L-alanine amidase AmpD
MGTVLVDGREHRCAAVVKRDPRFTFSGLGRRESTRAVCLHWTGGRRGGPAVFRTLQVRGLSVQFNIDADGTIWQFCDAALRCSHATGANSWSIGVEMTNPAQPKQATGDAPRAVVVESIHGQDVQHTTFTAAQVTAALALVDTLCQAYGLPLAVPMDGRDVLSTVMPKAQLDTFRGVMGHLHTTRRKLDPGIAILRAVAARDPVNGFADGEDLGPLREAGPV